MISFGQLITMARSSRKCKKIGAFLFLLFGFGLSDTHKHNLVT